MLLALLRIDWSVPIAASPAAASTITASIILQKPLAASPQAVASITPSITLIIPLGAAPAALATLNARIGNSLAASVATQATIISSSFQLTIKLSALLQPQAMVTASLVDLWNRESPIGIWSPKVNLGIEYPPFGLLGLSWKSGQRWGNKSKSADPWIRRHG